MSALEGAGIAGVEGTMVLAAGTGQAGPAGATGTTHGPVAVWAAIVAVGICTFALRFSFIYLFGRVETVPPRVQRLLRYVPPAVFAAIAVPAVVSVDGGLGGTLTDDRFLAAVAAALVAWRTESVLATIVVGMGALWTLRFLL